MKDVSHIKSAGQDFTRLNLSLLILFWLMSIVEFVLVPQLKYTHLGIKMLNDVSAVALIALVSAPIFFGLAAWSRQISKISFTFIYAILILGQVALVKYSTTTFVNLGADILGYSLDDIYMTANASKAFSLTNIVVLAAIPALFLGVLYVLRNVSLKPWSRYLFIIAAVIGVLLQWMLPSVSKPLYQHKLSFLLVDVLKFQNQKENITTYDLSKNKEYPFLKNGTTDADVLAPFFNLQTDTPNIVMLVVEGLGSEFVGDYAYAGCTPYLDQLRGESLYWKNFISNTGRSFGLLPSLRGSLPYGDKGFLEIKETPSHLSLFTLLKDNGYTTSFYAGHKSSFDKKINYLEYSGVDYILDENSFGPKYEKAKVDAKGFTWGYPDDQILKKTLALVEDRKLPRLDVILTLTTHEPFEFPGKEVYLSKIDSILQNPNALVKNKQVLEQNPDVFASLLYVDDAIKNFMEAYKKRPDYNNTIFIISGDHRLIPVSQKDQLCRYHVPLFIHSPMLKSPKTFASLSSHWDVAPSLLALLKNNYNINLPQQVAWMGEGIDTATQFRNTHNIPLMRYKGNLNDYLFEDYLYSEGSLYKINPDMSTVEVEDSTRLAFAVKALSDFKIKNRYVSHQDKLYPKELNVYVKPSTSFSDAEQERIASLTKGLTFDQAFRVAQQKAFAQDYETAQLLCTYILDEVPNHVDARILFGRTLAWQKNYESAENEFLHVLIRTPYYEDAYVALFDLYWWSDQEKTKSIPLMKKVQDNQMRSEVLLFKMAKAHLRMGNTTEARMLIDQLLELAPTNQDYLNLKKNV